jgi:pimeloyl-ACP methyl ester carboxylesterase
MPTTSASNSAERGGFPPVEGVEVGHRFLEVGGARLHVAEAGAGEPLLLIHGYPQHWWVWRRAMAHFAATRRVICPDLRGFGWSDAPAGAPYDKESLLQDVIGILDVLGVERADVAGHDWGGWIAYLMGMRHPDRVRRIVALSIIHPFHRPTPRFAANLWHLWHGQVLGLPGIGSWAADPRTIAGRLIARWLGAGSWTADERRLFLGQFDDPARRLATHRLYADVRRIDMPRMLRGRYRRLRLEVPALLVVGSRDRCLLPNRMSELHRYAPAMRLEAVDAAHAVLEEQPQRTIELIDRFLR